MARLVVVSNRVALPRERAQRAGGLAVALREELQRVGGIWFGWSGEVSEAADGKPQVTNVGKVTYVTLDLSPRDLAEYYTGYANSTLWPLCHYRLGLIDFHRSQFEGYLRVNAAFAKALKPFLRPDDIIWVHDYHFVPLGAELRRLDVGNLIGFFFHIPFPAAEVFRALPAHRRLVRDLCAYDLVGLQTATDVRTFTGYILNEAGGSVSPDGSFQAFGLRSRVGAFPIGIDTDAFAATAREHADAPETIRLKQSLVGRHLVIGVDRLDYSKGIPQKVEAFYELLGRWPEHASRVTFMQIAPVSRGEVAQYRTLRRDIEARAGRLNGKFAEFDWVPVRYLNKSFARATLAGFYRAARVGFVTPLRDGMNLVAKEYIAAQDPEDPGVLVLSTFAGAAHELTAALLVNPFDVDQLAEALHQSLVMPREERKARYVQLMDVLRTNTLSAWRDHFLNALQSVRRT